MKSQFIIDDSTFFELVETISKDSKFKVEEDCGEIKLKLDNHHFVGCISSINLEYGVGVLCMNMTPKESGKIEFKFAQEQPLLFLYNCGPTCYFENNEGFTEIEENISLLYASKAKQIYSLNFKENVPMKWVLISVLRSAFLEKVLCELETFPNEIIKLFKDVKSKENFLYHATSLPQIIAGSTQLLENDRIGLERKLIAEGKVYELIIGLIKSYRVQVLENTSNYKFIGEDYSRVAQAKDIILANLTDPPKVKYLAKKVGLNQSKLQIGFRLLYGKPIKQFAIGLRLNKALRLLQEGEMNCSEVARNIGYTNKGHFSKVFKEEFGVLPSETLQ